MGNCLNFELIHPNNNKAVLLFHGMTGSPFELKKFGQHLYLHGFDVYADCLPGHGDDFNNIQTVTYNDWLAFAYQKFEELNFKYDEIYVGGLCLGALLALAIAEKYQHCIQGILSLSTTLFLDGTRMPWYTFLIPIGFSTITRFFYTYPEGEPYGIKNEKTRYIIKKLLEKNHVGLDNYPMSCIYELSRLSKIIQKNLEKIFAPILIIHSTEDDLTSPKSAFKVYNEISSADKSLILLENSYHMILYDNEKKFVFQACTDFINKYTKTKEKLLC